MVNYIAIAIPVFFVLIGVEVVVARGQGKRLYRFNDAVTDLGCGMGQQVTHELEVAPAVERNAYDKFDTDVPRGLNLYVAVQVVPIAAATFALTWWQQELGELLTTGGVELLRRGLVDAPVAYALRVAGSVFVVWLLRYRSVFHSPATVAQASSRSA